MLAGDGLDAPHAAAAADDIALAERAAAALLPDDLCIAIEGTSGGRLLLIAVGLLVALALGVYSMEWMTPDPHFNLWLGNCAFLAAGFAGLAWLANRDLVRRRRAFRLVNGGIEVQITPLTGGRPRVTFVPWREVADYIVSVDSEKAFLRVVSVRDFTLTLDDRPPRLSTREFIRRFVERAERYALAMEPEPRAGSRPLPDITGERDSAFLGCATWLVPVGLGSFVSSLLEVSRAQQTAGWAASGVIAFGVYLWWTLDDDDIAVTDRGSRRLIARLRRWLRRVMGIRVS